MTDDLDRAILRQSTGVPRQFVTRLQAARLLNRSYTWLTRHESEYLTPIPRGPRKKIYFRATEVLELRDKFRSFDGADSDRSSKEDARKAKREEQAKRKELETSQSLHAQNMQRLERQLSKLELTPYKKKIKKSDWRDEHEARMREQDEEFRKKFGLPL